MRLDGDGMVIGIKDAAKLIGISVISCCAVLVCTMFLNYYFDISEIKDLVLNEQAVVFYNAQVSTAKVVCFVSGGCLFITSLIMLVFYIKHYIDIHKKELGILKALGYSEMKIAKNFFVFGISIFMGAAVGFSGAFLLMPVFYETQNEDKILPEIAIHFHPEIFIYFVILPTIVFALLSIFYAFIKLKQRVILLLKDDFQVSSKKAKQKSSKDNDCIFIDDLRKTTLKSGKTLVFFIIFASFCFSSMVQMSASMKDLSSAMMGIMIFVIGVVLAFTTLFIAITTVVKGNTKTIAMMQVFGYSQKECCKAILGGYRPVSYIGFAIGTVYQYVLLRIMVDIVFRDFDDVPVYKFDFPVMLICLALFIVSYEVVMYRYFRKIREISVKEIMIE